jgi:hypothetical protein
MPGENKARDKKINIVWSHSYEILRVVKFIETESSVVVTGAEGMEKWGASV